MGLADLNGSPLNTVPLNGAINGVITTLPVAYCAFKVPAEDTVFAVPAEDTVFTICRCD